MGESDAGLMAAPRLDAPEGVEQLVERYGERAYRLAVRITGVGEDAVEAVQDALLTAARTIRPFADDSVFASWFDRTVAREAHRSRQRRDVGQTSLDDVVPPLAGDGHFEPMRDWSIRLDEPALQGGLRAILAEAIDALPADCRTALILNDTEALPKPDIAEILDVDVQEVKSRVHRARLFVRKRLSEYFEAETA